MLNLAIKMVDDISSFQGDSRYTWVLDPGHGKLSGKEWEFTHDVARKVSNELLRLNISHFVTVDEDVDDCHTLRVARTANLHAKNKIFISIHSGFGHGEWTSANGICAFYKNTEQSKDIAEAFQSKLIRALRWFDLGIRSKDPESYILRKNTIPSIQLEIGVWNNKKQYAALQDETVRQKIVIALVEAIRAYEKRVP